MNKVLQDLVQEIIEESPSLDGDIETGRFIEEYVKKLEAFVKDVIGKEATPEQRGRLYS